MSKTQRLIVVFRPSVKPVQAASEMQAISTMMTGNVHFPGAGTALAAAAAHLTILGKAINDAKNKVAGAVAVRKSALITVNGDAAALKAIVQSAADADLVNAEAIILSSGMKVRKNVVRTKATFVAKWGKVSGTVLLVAKAVANRASYMWEWSLDGKAWTTLPSTLQARTTVHGLTPATTYYFRFKATLKVGEQDWGQTVSLLVK